MCIGFEKFPEKKLSGVCVSWKKSRNILLPNMVQSHHQIEPNAIKLLLSTGLSSSIIPVLSLDQSSVSAKSPNISKAKNQKRIEKLSFLFSMVLTPP